MNLRIALLVGAALSATTLYGEVVYSSIQSPLTPGVASLAYAATQTSEIGNAVSLAPGDRSLNTISVVMANWAYQSGYLSYETLHPEAVTSTGFYVPLTMNLYNTTGTDAVGSLFATKTVNTLINWRPEPGGGTCSGGTYFAAGDCYNSQASIVTFDFSGDGVTLPDNLIFGLAMNTTSYGYSPTGVANAPYDSLNFGIDGVGTPSVGSNIYASTDSMYINSAWVGLYTSPGPGVPGTFSRDTYWSTTGDLSGVAYQPNFEITATPEPGTFIMLGGSVGLLAFIRRKRIFGAKR